MPVLSWNDLTEVADRPHPKAMHLLFSIFIFCRRLYTCIYIWCMHVYHVMYFRKNALRDARQALRYCMENLKRKLNHQSVYFIEEEIRNRRRWILKTSEMSRVNSNRCTMTRLSICIKSLFSIAQSLKGPKHFQILFFFHFTICILILSSLWKPDYVTQIHKNNVIRYPHSIRELNPT